MTFLMINQFNYSVYCFSVCSLVIFFVTFGNFFYDSVTIKLSRYFAPLFFYSYLVLLYIETFLSLFFYFISYSFFLFFCLISPVSRISCSFSTYYTCLFCTILKRWLLNKYPANKFICHIVFYIYKCNAVS